VDTAFHSAPDIGPVDRIGVGDSHSHSLLP
jgi:hypothetical protein